MNPHCSTIPMPDGAEATLTIPQPVTPERIRVLEQALQALFRDLRRDAGALEYDSWRAAA